MASNTSHKPAPEAAQKTAILVLGMHRSGTSALTGLLNLFGAATPKQQIPASTQNARGFFEATRIARLNDKLLQHDELTWDSWMPCPPHDESDQYPNDLTEQACEILQDEFGDASVIALKDPRICRLVPFWADALHAWGRQPFFLLAMRNPIEVAQSLHVRNDFEISHGLLLWMTYVLESEASTRGKPRAFSTFDLLMNEPLIIVDQLKSTLALPQKAISKKKQAQIDAFLSPELRHHESGDLAGLPPIFNTIYTLMTRWGQTGEDPADYQYLDRVREEYAAITAQDGDADALVEALTLTGQVFTDTELQTRIAASKKLHKPILLAEHSALLRAHAALSAMHEQNQTHPERAAHMKTAVQEHKQAMDQAQETANAHFKEMAALSQMLGQAQTEGATLRQAVQISDARIADLDNDMHILRKRLKADQASLGHTSRENAELHALVAQVETARARVQGDNDGLNAMVADVEKERVRVQSDNDGLNAVVARVEQERVRLATENEELHGLVNKVETERARIHDDNIGLNALVAQVETERARLAQENTELHALVHTVETQRHALISSLSWRLSRPVRLVGRILRKLRG